eukprot:9029051-Pyramimonas_sp.AAC.1
MATALGMGNLVPAGTCASKRWMPRSPSATGSSTSRAETGGNGRDWPAAGSPGPTSRPTTH